MVWGMVFGQIIRFVGFSWAPVNEEVSLACLILDSIESHCNCFELFLEVELMMHNAVVLSVSIGAEGC